VDLFAEDSSVELNQRGIFVGKAGVRRMFLEKMGGGQVGLTRGRLFNHFQIQEIVTVSPDGQAAQARFRTFAQAADFGSVKHSFTHPVTGKKVDVTGLNAKAAAERAALAK
jgi:hypothetical protein